MRCASQSCGGTYGRVHHYMRCLRTEEHGWDAVAEAVEHTKIALAATTNVDDATKGTAMWSFAKEASQCKARKDFGPVFYPCACNASPASFNCDSGLAGLPWLNRKEMYERSMALGNFTSQHPPRAAATRRGRNGGKKSGWASS
ncbi:hypothetical protein AC578_8639 [Pseudocercospora eumusae]|uniref:Uncharacterized protein n=1 Tax=Pseudocercospora eumusae TaxID=321146 RepID=A0A139HQ18_9PEZI|nr:hypothetical protein AC578_8639 [Pseudocercospora eumusae]